MKIENWSGAEDLSQIYLSIRDLGLETNLAELEAFGFTVVEDALSPKLTQDLKEAILATAESRSGIKPDEKTGESHPGPRLEHYLLFKNPVFEEALMNPKALALITYLLGKSCLLSSMTSHMKGPGGKGLDLHPDVGGNGVTAPFPAHSMAANCNYALTDYSKEGGSFAVVPGSHKYCRHPRGWEHSLEDDGNRNAIPLEVPAGSAIIYHGNTWHGSYVRKIPGFRINLAMFFCRRFLDPQEHYRDAVPKELLDRNDERFAKLTGQDIHHGWGEKSFDPVKFSKGNRAGRSLFS